MLKNKLYVYGEGKLEVPAHINFGQDILDNMMKNKDKDALINANTNRSIKYGDLAQQTVDIALSLARMGIGKGDVISICSEKCFEYFPTVLGIICAGATFASSDLTSGTTSLLHRVVITKPKLIFLSPTAYKTHCNAFRTVDSIKTYVVFGDEAQPGAILFKDFLTEHACVEDFQPVPVDGLNDNMLFLFSSGTTGLPKGIPYTHLSSLICFKHNMMIDSSRSICVKNMLNTREWCYSYGLMYTLACLNHGVTVIYCQEYNIEDFLKAIQKYKIELLQLTPSTVNELIKSPIIQDYDVTSLELIVSASTTLMGDTVMAVKKVLSGVNKVSQLYGMSEAGAVCSDARVPNGSKPGSVGVASPGFVIKVVDIDTRKPLGPNQRGEICYKSPTLTAGYVGSDSSNIRDEEGFFKTGDLGYYDEDRCFYIVDRLKELIKFNDYAIAPAELEAVLQQHPLVLEAGVVGATHAEYGQVAVAFVALRNGGSITEDDLVTHVNSQVTHRMRLAGGVRFVSSLPRGAGDKLDRKALKKMLMN